MSTYLYDDALVNKIRATVPNITLRTTLITGFPGETDEDFEKLLAFVKEAKFERLGAFIYSREEGTPAYDMPDQVPENMKKAAQGGFINATDLADYLVKKGMPFRSAYKISGQLVALCISKGTATAHAG